MEGVIFKGWNNPMWFKKKKKPKSRFHFLLLWEISAQGRKPEVELWELLSAHAILKRVWGLCSQGQVLCSPCQQPEMHAAHRTLSNGIALVFLVLCQGRTSVLWTLCATPTHPHPTRLSALLWICCSMFSLLLLQYNSHHEFMPLVFNSVVQCTHKVM